MSIKTTQEKLDYAKEMLADVQKWATPASQDVEFWRNIIAKFEKEKRESQ